MALASDDRAPVALLVLCGLPAAGKTSIARALQQGACRTGPEPICVHHQHFDDALEAALCNTGGSFSAAAWQVARQASLAALEENLAVRDVPGTASAATGCGAPTTQQMPRLVIADDNMQYRSMRYQCFKLARKCGAAYLQIFVQCSPELAIRRNAQREGVARVPEAAIRRMAEVLEPPQPQLHTWEQPVLKVCAAEAGGWNVDELWEWVRASWGPAVPAAPSVIEEDLRKQLDRSQTAENALHQLDICTRRMLSTTLAKAPKHLQPSLAKELNAGRRALLSKLRSQWPQAASQEVQGVMVDALVLEFDRLLSSLKNANA